MSKGRETGSSVLWKTRLQKARCNRHEFCLQTTRPGTGVPVIFLTIWRGLIGGIPGRRRYRRECRVIAFNNRGIGRQKVRRPTRGRDGTRRGCVLRAWAWKRSDLLFFLAASFRR